MLVEFYAREVLAQREVDQQASHGDGDVMEGVESTQGFAT